MAESKQPKPVTDDKKPKQPERPAIVKVKTREPFKASQDDPGLTRRDEGDK